MGPYIEAQSRLDETLNHGHVSIFEHSCWWDKHNNTKKYGRNEKLRINPFQIRVLPS